MRKLAPKGVVCGLDEVGRGSIAGPLTVACVALPDEPQVVGIDDSKKLSPKRREKLAACIEETALGIGIAHIAPEEIDAAGMAASLRAAFGRALEESKNDLESRGNERYVEGVLIDGNPLHLNENEVSIVKGDAKVACIAAASIVAKVERDALMRGYAKEFPQYCFESNKGYGSAAHIKALKRVGPCSIHRRSFLGNILAEQQTLL